MLSHRHSPWQSGRIPSIDAFSVQSIRPMQPPLAPSIGVTTLPSVSRVAHRRSDQSHSIPSVDSGLDSVDIWAAVQSRHVEYNYTP